MSRNINERLEPNTTIEIDALIKAPDALSAYPVFRFIDTGGSQVTPNVGKIKVEHSIDGLKWYLFNNGSIDLAQGAVGEMYFNGNISYVRITTSELTGIDYIDFTLHLDDLSQSPHLVVIADTFISRNIKRGRQFALTYELEIPATEKRYFSAVTGDDIVSLKVRQVNTDGGMRYLAYKNSTFVNGSPLPVDNLNGLSTRISKTKFYDVPLPPTVLGTPIPSTRIRSPSGVGANRQPGIFGGLDIERIIPPNVEQLIEIENKDNKTIFVVVEYSYYEGPIQQLPEDI